MCNIATTCVCTQRACLCLPACLRELPRQRCRFLHLTPLQNTHKTLIHWLGQHLKLAKLILQLRVAGDFKLRLIR